MVPVSLRDRSHGLSDLVGEEVTATGVLLPVITIGFEALYPELEATDERAIRPLDPSSRRRRRMARLARLVGLVTPLPLTAVLGGLLFLRRQSRLRALAVAADRRRIAGELHDSVAQCLSGTKILLTSIRGELDALPTAVHENLEAACGLLDRTRHEVRAAINDLRNDNLLTKPLDRLLVSEGARLDRLGPASVSVSVAGRPGNLSPEVKRDVLAIVQEASANAMRHGGARSVHIDARPCGRVDTRSPSPATASRSMPRRRRASKAAISASPACGSAPTRADWPRRWRGLRRRRPSSSA